LISESADGPSVAATRQNGGRSRSTAGPRPGRSLDGSLRSSEAPMVLASVMDVFGCESAESASHADRCCADACGGQNTITIATNTSAAFFMRFLAAVRAGATLGVCDRGPPGPNGTSCFTFTARRSPPSRVGS
jgi:hypothetical protein